MGYNVTVIGASGYAGAQLVSLLSGHREVSGIRLAVQSKPGVPYVELYPGFDSVMNLTTIPVDSALATLHEADVLFLALPHGISMELLASVTLPEHLRIIDLGADFRLKDPEAFQYWYDTPHRMAASLSQWVYGLPELNRTEIAASRFIANPGCYPTASLLGLMPALRNGLIHPESIVIDAKSGISGAGRGLSLSTHFCESHDSIKAYGVAGHRHTAEIEQTVGQLAGRTVPLTFTPHLMPMQRGILATLYGTVTRPTSTEELLALYKEQYQPEPFVRVRAELPETRWVSHSNYCDISVRYDARTQRMVAVSAIDNLVKGAAGQALQNMNIQLGLPETTGLPMLPIIP